MISEMKKYIRLLGQVLFILMALTGLIALLYINYLWLTTNSLRV